MSCEGCVQARKGPKVQTPETNVNANRTKLRIPITYTGIQNTAYMTVAHNMDTEKHRA